VRLGGRVRVAGAKRRDIGWEEWWSSERRECGSDAGAGMRRSRMGAIAPMGLVWCRQARGSF
jgi:hypothetical protein